MTSTFLHYLVSLPCMRIPCSLVFIATIGLAPESFAQAEIEGRVELPRTPAAQVIVKRYEIVTKGGVLAPEPPLAVVYLEGSFPKKKPVTATQMLQKDLTFVPALLPVQTGTRVAFPNLDDTYHNIFSFSPAKRFDLGRYRPDEKPTPSVVFDVPGLVTVRCDIHSHMRALILVIDTPHFVMSDADGRFRLSGLPSGHHTLKAWLSSKTTLERPVELTSGSTLRANFP
ncbi:MAG TPA: carboxypeptidase regulatory-like domain-containing protein [Chthoniobacterales bacterium]|nr:carboxypeptidase regulatory-like domain-containing protein [Chthoniobacterales bacterium]